MVSSQLRLRPGIYTRRKSNGEIEGHVNVQGKGASHRYFLDPETGVFRMSMGQAKLPLISVLRAIGTTDDELRKAWGNDLLAANMPHDSPHALEKLRDRLARPSERTGDAKEQIAKAMAAMVLDPEVTRRTLGRPFDRVSKEAVLATTKKLLAVHKLETEPDDRDHLAYQSVHGPEDFIAERLGRDQGALRTLLWQATLKNSLEHVKPGFFDKAIAAGFMGSGLTANPEGVSAAEFIDHASRVTRMGEGGIGTSAESIPVESRSIHPSHLGFLDLVKSPECHDKATQVFTYRGWIAWPDVTEDDKLACLVDNKLEFHRPIKLHRGYYEGLMYGAQTQTLDYLVTPTHRMWCKTGDSDAKWRFEIAAQIHNKSRIHLCAGWEPWEGTNKKPFELPQVAAAVSSSGWGSHLTIGTRSLRQFKPLEIGAWCEFLGWYLSEGCVNNRRTNISQSKTIHPENCQRIEELLIELGFKWSVCKRYGQVKGYSISRKQLSEYLKQFGYSYDKWIPEEALRATAVARQRLFEALMLGDGRRDKRGKLVNFCTSSERLAHDFEWLALSLGYATSIRVESENRKDTYRDMLIVRAHLRKCRQVHANRPWLARPSQYYIQNYSGVVYCATVPGGLLYTRRNNRAGFWSGNSSSAGVDLRIAFGVQKGTDNNLYAPFRDVKSSRIVYRSPDQLDRTVVALPGELVGNKPHVAAMSGGKLTYVPREQVELELPSMEQSFSPLSNLVPLKSAAKGQRVSMGARFISQALPLVEPEARLVRSAVPGQPGKSYDELYAKHMGAVFADQPGKVVKVTPDEITVRYEDGTKKTHELYNNVPGPRKSGIHNTSLVRQGDYVRAGQPIAKSNFTTANGEAAFGANARIAYLPYLGQPYEDAALVSESFAKRLTSDHMYQHKLDWNDSHLRGKRAYVSMFPGNYTKKELESIDDSGLIKPGTIVNFNDPLVLVASQREHSYGQVHRGAKSNYSDHTMTWDHHSPGIVTDVTNTRRGVNVVVRTTAPLQEGDKLCYSEDTEILTLSGWKSTIEVTVKDKVASLTPSGELEYIEPVAVHRYPHNGRMYALDAKQISLLVTDNHNLYISDYIDRRSNYGQYKLVAAADMFGKSFRLKNNAEWCGQDPACAELPGYTTSASSGSKEVAPLRLDPKTYAALLGSYLSERAKIHQPISTGRRTTAVLSHPTKTQRLTAALNYSRIKFGSSAYAASAELNGAQLRRHFQQMELNDGKCIPTEVFSWSKETLTVLFDWLFWGNGSPLAVTHTYITGSERLADDIQRLCLHVGHAARITNADLDHTYGRTSLRRGHFKVCAYCNKNNPAINHSQSRELNEQFERWENYDGNVYCVTLPRNHVLYVRRNGKPVWCGNSNQFGGKSVVLVSPDQQMPQDKDGKPFDMAWSALSLLSRINPAWVIESQLGKVAAKTGKSYTIEDWGKIPDLTKFAQDELKKNDLTDTETVIDPRTGRHIPDVLTGTNYIMKLHHLAESKAQGRGLGAYSASGEPTKTPGSNARRFSLGDTNALLQHGASGVLQDAKAIRGQKNEQFWLAFMGGYPPPHAQVPFIYEKFLNELKGAGINVMRDGPRLRLMALTDKDVNLLAGNRELKNAETVRFDRNLEPVPGGLFSPELFGNADSASTWGKITLAEPLVNPAFEDPVRHMLGLTQKKFEDVFSGKEALSGKTGPHAIQAALAGIDVPKEMERARADIASGRKSARDMAVRKLQYLKTLDQLKMNPSDWVLSAVPVLPPAYRPVSRMQGGRGQLISDANYVYKELFDANQNLKSLKGQVDDISEERKTLYNALKGVVGLGDPIHPKNTERGVKGLLKNIFGDNPKRSTLQMKLLGTTVDTAGAGVIVPGPDLDMDHIGIPESKAWDVYAPFIVRRLVRRGMQRTQALRAVEDKDKYAKDAMLEEMNERPVLVNRYPILHKYNLIALRPTLVHGDNIRMSPLITKSMAADHDGDTSAFHVPISDKAVKDAYDKMLPSKNIFSAATFRATTYLPNAEYLQGLHAASTAKDEKSPVKVFRSKKDALAAYHRGEIGLGQQVEIM